MARDVMLPGADRRTRARRRGLAPVMLACLALAASCSSSRLLPRTAPEELAWPPEGPYVRLLRVIADREDLGRGRWLRRLTGRPPRPMFARPFATAWRGDDLLVTDPGARTLVRISAGGRVSTAAADLFETPIGVASCNAGIVVTDSSRGRVALLDDRLQLVRWVARDLARPTGVACQDRRLFIVETAEHRVLALAPQGWVVELPPPGRRMQEHAGRFFIPASAGERILVFEPDSVAGILGGRGEAAGEFNYPTTISAGLGSLWVGDTLNFRLQRFDPLSGEFEAAFGRLGDSPGELPRLKGVGIDARGHLWISDGYTDEVAIFRADGTFLMSIGGRGTGAGEFSGPAGIAAHPDGRMAIVDSLNRRLQIFRVLSREAAG